VPALNGASYETDVLTFAGTLISARAVARLGLPRSEFFMGFEEHEFCLRARAAGMKLVAVPQTLIVSHDPVPRGDARPPWRGYYQTRNHLAMALQHHSPQEAMWWALRQVKFIVATLLLLDRKWERIRLRLLGAWHALAGRGGRIVDPTSCAASTGGKGQ
jgi:GT2 family glycosyltransferase